jgi:hypothetical protein
MSEIREALNNVGRHSCGTGVRDDENLFAWMEAVTTEIERLSRRLDSHAHPISGMPSCGGFVTPATASEKETKDV